MTPEQERNHWILAGYPLMPEWIEFCKAYSAPLYDIQAPKRWMQLVREYYDIGVGPDPECRFTAHTHDTYKKVDFIVADTRYVWNTGEDHAEQS